jgi:DNA-binding MarR family transcriptional regulator
MDTASGISAAEAGRQLGTTIPRVKRAIARLRLPVEAGGGGRVAIGPDAFAALREELGTAEPLDGLSRVEVAVLAALDRAPFGLASVRAVAARAGVAPTSAARALARLESDGLVERRTATVAAGVARAVELFVPRRSSRRWRRLAPPLGRVRAARRGAGASSHDVVVPARLRHLFWNVAPGQLDVVRSGGFIARRLLQAGDPEGLAWGAATLTSADWEHGARTRGLDPRTRRLARNLAAAAARPER